MLKKPMNMKLLKSLSIRFAGTVLLFPTVVGIGTSLALLVSSSFGYLPYSDRPGPGWWGRVHWPTWAETSTYFGFALWFAYFCIFFGLGLFALSLILGYTSTPRWANRILGGIASAAAAYMAVMGAGWYLALAQIGPDTAIFLGLIYGIFLFPRFIKTRPVPLKMWIRVALPTASTGLLVLWIVWPLIPKTPVPAINYDLVRVTPGEKAFTATSFLGFDIATTVSAMAIRGDTHGGIGGGGGGAGQNTTHIDIQLIALEPIRHKAELAIPQSGGVVYILKNGEWSAHPAIGKKDKRTLTIEPGINPQYDGGRVKLNREDGNLHPFTWYPTIPNGP